MPTNTAEFRILIDRRSFMGGSPLVQGPEKRSDAEPSNLSANAVGTIRNAAEEMRQDENWRAS
jgi:hypothetical protein